MTDSRDARLGTAYEVELPAGTLRYHAVGDGPPIVFVHGYLVNANLWRKLVPLLAGQFRCITPDWPLGSHLVPMNRDADLSPPGIATLIADFLIALDLRDVILFGNDSGGAYSQLAAATYPERIGRLVLASCETPDCTWPPTPGGFPLLKRTAVHPLTYRALYQVLRWPGSWRWRNTYGWLAKYPIDDVTMRSYIDPVLNDSAIRYDGRKAIGSVDERYSRGAAATLVEEFGKPVDLLWAGEDHVFPTAHATAYAERLGTRVHLIPDSFTYVAEDRPELVAREGLARWQQ
ncbi:pimeloyl-ACP methyl ester carboxylesterase [Kribbella sp. VKM Ac-2571]|uniref:alpha/beta fold hydrolase n=1 Tax=Kribbella sp. VKM Ac-2571 TaxID=2512222 RepID=UPI001061DAD3|nr:alpha/beta hydrolase [Kribbella sp. VKM Ac-2571]TDO66563.1 pimeloyl-ACP methyl ester carboxylesterase [Kribbella sp. VKM Ac-2571]